MASFLDRLHSRTKDHVGRAVAGMLEEPIRKSIGGRFRRAMVGILGGTMALAGVALLVLPGPGDGFGANGLRDQDMNWRPNELRRNAVNALYAQTPELSFALIRFIPHSFRISEEDLTPCQSLHQP
jgi:hypothetical protein